MIKSDANADIASRWSSPEGEISYQEDSENEEQLAHCKLPLYVLVQICHLFGFFLHESHGNRCIRQEWRLNSQRYKGRQVDY